MPLSFAVERTRPVPLPGWDDVDGPRWTVKIRKSGRWRGWVWLDWVWDRCARAAVPGATDIWALLLFAVALLPFLLSLLALPTIVGRVIAYRCRGRTDWDVLVYYATDDRANLLFVQPFPTKADAVRAAEAVWTHLSVHDDLPDPFPV